MTYHLLACKRFVKPLKEKRRRERRKIVSEVELLDSRVKNQPPTPCKKYRTILIYEPRLLTDLLTLHLYVREHMKHNFQIYFSVCIFYIL